MEDIGEEMRQAARRLVRTPAFTVPAALTLALAIGANAALFAVVHRVVLNPLPYGDSGRLIALDFGVPVRNVPSGFNSMTSRLYFHYVDRARALDGFALYRADELNLTGQRNPERIRVARTTASLASVLRVTPEVGRWFTEPEDLSGQSPVAVISHGLWVRRYGQDRAILGQIVRLEGVPTTIVGVMPPSYAFPDPRTDIWIPALLTRATASDAYNFRGIARLRNGATIADARSELTYLTRELETAHPGNGYAQLVSTATTLIEATVGRVRSTLWILLASVGLVLLVACANVGNLFLVRSEVRQREVALRRALGAGSLAIARYYLSESALLSIAGGTIGLALASGAIYLLVAVGPTNLPRLEEVRLDSVVLAFTLALSLLSAVAFGSIPSLRLTPRSVTLHEGGHSNTASRVRHRARHLLMGGQIALALVLLVSSGLMLRSFQKLRAVDPGFNATDALTFRVGLPRSDYPDRGEVVAAHRAILDRLSALPRVTAVSVATCLPLAEQLCQGGPLFVEGRPLPAGTIAPFVRIHAVAGGYFGAMGIRLLRGHSIESRDIEREEPIVVVNEALVKVAFPNQEPIGQRIRLGNPSLAPGAPEWLTVVGVASNTPYATLTETTPSPQLFMPMYASRNVNMAPRLDAMSYVVRTALPPAALAGPVRSAIGELDANLALAQVRTLQEILDRASAQTAFTMILLIIAAGVALMLGMIGIYGVMSYIVTQRTAEIGIRLALGAKPGSVAGAIVRQGAIVTLVGVAAGLVTALAGGRAIKSLLYGVSPRDPAVFAATTVLLLGVALLVLLC
jgi:putative ABC transport system permease protein